MPSLLPSTQPTRSTTIPLLSPVDKNEVVIIAKTNYQLISGDDITWILIQSDTFGESESYFNSGFKNSLISTIKINLKNEAKVNLFESWQHEEFDVNLQ